MSESNLSSNGWWQQHRVPHLSHPYRSVAQLGIVEGKRCSKGWLAGEQNKAKPLAQVAGGVPHDANRFNAVLHAQLSSS